MRLRYLLPAAVLIGLIVLFAVGLRHDPREVPSPLIGKPAPALSLMVLGSDGTWLQTSELHGRPVLVNYFASWCAVCGDEHPFLMQLAAQGVEIIGVDYKDTEADGLAWLQRHGNPYRTVISDPEGSAGLDWGVYGAPETYVLDAQGTIVYKQVGALNEAIWQQRIAGFFAKAAPWKRLRAAVLIAGLSLSLTAGALTPEQDARYQTLINQLRCLVCQNQTIADSSAPLAADLRKQVATQIAAGRSDAEIKRYLTDRYGDFVLYKPPFKRSTWLLWLAPFAVLLLALAAALRFARRRPARSVAPVNALALDDLLQEARLAKPDQERSR